jgi:hypothetical protein
MDPVSIHVVPEGGEAERMMEVMIQVQNPNDLKQISFDQVQKIASAFGLDAKLVDITEGRQAVKTCYYRKPAVAPDELVVVVR